jgi:hypothetical protein
LERAGADAILSEFVHFFEREVEFVGFRCSGDNIEIALYVKLFPCVIVISACDELRLIFIERIRSIVVNQSLIYVEGDHVGDVLLV